MWLTRCWFMFTSLILSIFFFLKGKTFSQLLVWIEPWIIKGVSQDNKESDSIMCYVSWMVLFIESDWQSKCTFRFSWFLLAGKLIQLILIEAVEMHVYHVHIVYILLWLNLFFGVTSIQGTPPFRGHKIWSPKTCSRQLIFVFCYPCWRGTPTQGKETLFPFPKTPI